jgi:hypothetical protein
MIDGSATIENEEAQGPACDLRFDVSCQYVLRDETVRILLAIVQAARKSEERHQSEAA